MSCHYAGMDWYVVIKTINGHRYYYRQKTWREGKRVRTRSEYIGPAGPEEAPRGVVPKVVEEGNVDAALSKAFEALNGKQSEKWEHHWRADRRGPSLVTKVPAVEKVFRALTVNWTDNTRGAYYRPGADEVNIPPVELFDTMNGQSATAAYYVVIFHELVHWTMHPMRTNRSTGRGSAGYAREELVAELGALTLMEHFGIDVGNAGRHAKYFQIWLRRTNNQSAALTHAKREAAKAVRFILKNGRIDT